MVLSDVWANQASPFTTPTFSNDDYYYFGANREDHIAPLDGLFPDQEINEQEIYGQYFPNLSTGTNPASKLSAKFVPVNGLPFYWMLGKAVDSGGNVTTITPMDGTAAKQRLSWWSETETIDKYVDGVVIGTLDLAYEMNRLGMNLTGMGLTHGLAASEPDTKTYPSNISSIYDVWNDGEWNSSDIQILRCNARFTQKLTGFPAAAGDVNGQISEFSTILSAWNVQMTATSGASLEADFRAGTARNFYSKWIKGKDSDKYIAITQNCLIKQLIPTRIFGNATLYSAVLVGASPSVAVKDGVAISFYGLS